MSEPAIHFDCPSCGASHDRGYFNGVDTFRCLRCGYVGGAASRSEQGAPSCQLHADCRAADQVLGSEARHVTGRLEQRYHEALAAEAAQSPQVSAAAIRAAALYEAAEVASTECGICDDKHLPDGPCLIAVKILALAGAEPGRSVSGRPSESAESSVPLAAGECPDHEAAHAAVRGVRRLREELAHARASSVSLAALLREARLGMRLLARGEVRLNANEVASAVSWLERADAVLARSDSPATPETE